MILVSWPAFVISITLFVTLAAHFCTVKKATAFLLLLVFLLHAFHASYLTAWFYQNRQWVAAKLCVNKNKPALKCNGHCFLSKKLKAAEEQQENGSAPAGKQSEESVPFVLYSEEPADPAVITVMTRYPSLECHYRFLHSSSLFHPPGHAAAA